MKRTKLNSILGRAYQNSNWDEIENFGSLFVDEDGASLDGFSIFGPRSKTVRCTCGEWMVGASNICRNCYRSFAAIRLQERIIRTTEYWKQIKERREEIYQARYERKLYWEFSRDFNGRLYRLKHRAQSEIFGESHHASKLTEACVADIRANYAPVPGFSCYAFSRKYGVSTATIQQVIHGDTWSHVGGRIIPVYGVSKSALRDS